MSSIRDRRNLSIFSLSSLLGFNLDLYKKKKSGVSTKTIPEISSRIHPEVLPRMYLRSAVWIPPEIFPGIPLGNTLGIPPKIHPEILEIAS